jgi:hypothetical protein
MDPVLRSRGGRKGALSRARSEHDAEMRLVADGFTVFSPYAVCDRIAIKNGRVFFVEFKKPGQALRPSQQLIHDLDPDGYIVRYYEQAAVAQRRESRTSNAKDARSIRVSGTTIQARVILASSFNGRTLGSDPGNRGSNPREVAIFSARGARGCALVS